MATPTVPPGSGRGKICSTCRRHLPISAFQRHASGKDGRRASCRACIAEIQAREAAKPEERGISPLPISFAAICPAALHIEPDIEHGLIAVFLAGEPTVRVLMAPEAALDLSLRLAGAVTRLRQEDAP